MAAWLLWAAVCAGDNLAAGRPCAFAPVPNYSGTTAGDALDLTDGRVSERDDQRLWFDPGTVAWSYVPLLHLRVDLGAVRAIDAVTLRLLGGSAQAGLEFPAAVRLLVSDDDATYHRVAEFTVADGAAFGLPPSDGRAWVHPLRFAELRTRGRYVGLAVSGTAMTAADELTVEAGQHDPAPVTFAADSLADFSVTRPVAAFLKPALVITSNLSTPQPLVLLDESRLARPLSLEFELPEGIDIVAGEVGRQAWSSAVADGRRRTITVPATGSSALPWAKLWFQGRTPGARETIRHRLTWEGGAAPWVEVPARVVEVPPAPRCRRLMLALGWWSLAATRDWPGGLDAARILGLNTLSTFTMWMDPRDDGLWQFAEAARGRGFRLLNVDSAWHQMLSRHEDDSSLSCQFADGTAGTRFCPSYRGPAYHEELLRVAAENARLKPDILSEDIELWGWDGPRDCERCTRCQADFQASGLADWAAWRLAKGEAMWRDLHDAVQSAVRAAGGRPVEMGVYDFRPGLNYQRFWPFDRLYADGLLRNSQVSTYTPLRPYHLGLIGDEARRDRALLPRTDGLPWLSPGDAGVFAAEDLRCALLECFLNGSRGVHFWSNRYWDGESFLGYNQAVHAVAAVEAIIADGTLFSGARVEPPARVSGMIRGDEVALLVADYHRPLPRAIEVRLDVPAAGRVTDAETGAELARLERGEATIQVTLDEHRSRVLRLEPR